LIYVMYFQDENEDDEDNECCACKKRKKTCGCPEPRKYHC